MSFHVKILSSDRIGISNTSINFEMRNAISKSQIINADASKTLKQTLTLTENSRSTSNVPEPFEKEDRYT
jgi:hypothetical protein